MNPTVSVSRRVLRGAAVGIRLADAPRRRIKGGEQLVLRQDRLAALGPAEGIEQ